MSKEFSRRDFLRLAGLGSISILVGGCDISQVAQPKEFPPKPEEIPKPPLRPTIEPTPIPIEEGKGDSPADILKSLKEKEGGLWTQELLIPPKTSSGQLPEAFFTSQDKLFLATSEGYPAAFNLTKGEKLWQWEDRGTVYGAEPETAYIVRPDKRLYALDGRNGETKWKTVLGVGNDIQVDWPLWIGEHTVRLPFRSIDGYSFLASIDKKNGNILWWDSEEWPPKTYDHTEQTIISISKTCEVIKGINPITGEIKWAFPLPRASPSTYVENPFIISGNFLFCLVASGTPGYSTPVVAAIDTNSGREVWRSKEESYQNIIAVSPTAVYALYSTGYAPPVLPWDLSVLDRQTGKELWTWPVFGYEKFGFVGFVGEIERLAIMEHENLGYTYGVEASTGTTLWMNDDLRLNRLVGISKNTLIGVYQPSFLFGLNPTTGERKWRLELSQMTHKVIIFGDKLIYGSGQTLAVLDPETGTLISTIPLPDRPTRLVLQKDFLLAQTGTPGGLGTLSAVRI